MALDRGQKGRELTLGKLRLGWCGPAFPPCSRRPCRMWQGYHGPRGAPEGDLPDLIVREVPWQLLVEALNPVAAVTVGLRQAEHSPASFPATPD